MGRGRGRLADLTSSLTLRGGCLVAAGTTLVLLGAVLGERSLVQVAVFVLALPALAAVGVVRARFRLASRRTVTPSRLPRGQDADVLLEVTNTDRRPGGLWAMSEQLPADLGPRPRFLVERLPSGATAALRYRVHGARRGRLPLGPLRLRLVDPFGLVLRTTSGVDTATLLVVPRVRPLGRVALSGGAGGGAAGARRSLAVHGEDDVSTREYRRGDDLRKVHWRATARTGELMVRLEEKPWRSSATLLVDTRQRAHVLGGELTAGPPGDPAPPPDTLEWVVEAAASIGDHLLAAGADLRVLTDTGELTGGGPHGGPDRSGLAEALAGVTASRATDLGTGLAALRRTGDGPLVCLLAAVTPEDVTALVRARSGPGSDVAVLVDTPAWHDATARGGAGRRYALAPGARVRLTQQQEQAAGLLRAAGWRVVTAGPQDAVETVWARVGAAAAGGRAVPA
ncbi:DUF58 domain-containing protein [Klenkia taihuensis]|uniref:Uncharacterized conserved protein, DUF58 family, contains vWF domain n=1 Tax=Klenkia taihuensis TaxID=1225127 RepID=A0A1I1T3G7_9ACTN|nr:DUF58 domain-containing protein [Klenkia taihuensis]GHE13111.1 membrane protein [Klenkia taihuensis]SFD51598.1 Uncharacterized conserved protein, DUF58 family, contains vWF domain [Klenkia taihuensis]